MSEDSHADTGTAIVLHQDHHATQDVHVGNEKGDQGQDVGGDAVHHHHCPAALAYTENNIGVTSAITCDDPVAGRAVPLTSRATAPPTQPPLA